MVRVSSELQISADCCFLGKIHGTFFRCLTSRGRELHWNSTVWDLWENWTLGLLDTCSGLCAIALSFVNFRVEWNKFLSGLGLFFAKCEYDCPLTAPKCCKCLYLTVTVCFLLQPSSFQLSFCLLNASLNLSEWHFKVPQFFKHQPSKQ